MCGSTRRRRFGGARSQPYQGLAQQSALASVLPSYYGGRDRSRPASANCDASMDGGCSDRDGETLKAWASRHVIRGRGLFTLMFWIALAAPGAMAQQPVDTVTETVTTRRDLNGQDAVSEKVVTHSARTKDEERVVIETYLPSLEAGRLALTQRVNRVTTVTEDRTQTIEETEERNLVSPSEPMRIVQRSLTTVRRSGTDSYVTEHQVFQSDGNGRLVLVRKQSEQASPN